ncbi:DUF411 domain-containing protein [Halopseudomonas salegens]|uniref:Uncharacterized conserved protein n=1 Tax=Halopseudomonas salegens TaxID=1434072 RepID=A0A1H2F6F9_9GAMM|nr:DUF411 domain-containing protein [Halopseudomonas salegens]SDU02568.1 Uncharacterized conserved protein [Halopseudomonas salegens]
MRTLFQRLVLAPTLVLALGQSAGLLADERLIDVYRDANCGCCVAWVDHLKDNGFTVNDHVVDDMTAVKIEQGVPPELSSCHTGVINGQFIEGHVPARDILGLQDQSDLLGLAVPRMPIGSPGMEMGDRKDSYEVIGLEADGSTRVVNQYH